MSQSKIVGLGESTHGSSEIYKMKDRISRYLISNSLFNIFSLEANMPESFLLNSYLLENKNDPKKILEGMYFWIWQTQETLNFIEWLKQYNKIHSPKVTFDGFDMQYASGALHQIKNVYNQYQIPSNEIEDLEKILTEENRGVRSYTNRSQNLIREILSKIKNRDLPFKSPEEKERFMQNIRIIEQKIQISNMIIRDQFMAENVSWIMKNNLNPKLIVSAHNYHISKLNKQRMGFYINEKFKNDYVNFGFAFYKGSFTGSLNRQLKTIIAQTAPSGTLEYYLSSFNIPIFILDLKSISEESNPLARWILKDIRMRKTGSGTENNEFQLTNVVQSFDYLIFINESSSSKLFKNYN
ncbi:erythromycin esterase [Epilithonimonas hungarica]|uniref:erythromycin esterase family protein n=1 Tax=Epilithonimonas hungarica TaxID=454006 RepID=UPI0027838673|nr:erythromycin esterase family protein [Epilithonimonas hungarica]MDP9956141.1 erythromycin esterase [Epilithonimonas hungarica]